MPLGTDLHAPVAGTTTAVNNVVGDQSGTDPVMVVATLDQLVVSVSFSEVDAGKVQVGQVAQVTANNAPAEAGAGGVVVAAVGVHLPGHRPRPQPGDPRRGETVPASRFPSSVESADQDGVGERGDGREGRVPRVR